MIIPHYLHHKSNYILSWYYAAFITISKSELKE